jgi:hypothetical protein
MSEWIKWSDKLPDIGQWVLIYTDMKGSSLIEIAMLDPLLGFVLDGRRGYAKNASHWMPLPLPPHE